MKNFAIGLVLLTFSPIIISAYLLWLFIKFTTFIGEAFVHRNDPIESYFPTEFSDEFVGALKSYHGIEQ